MDYLAPSWKPRRKARSSSWTGEAARVTEIRRVLQFVPMPMTPATHRKVAVAMLWHNLVGYRHRTNISPKGRIPEPDLCRFWLSEWFPDMSAREAKAVIEEALDRKRGYRAEALGDLMGLSIEARKHLDIRTFRAAGMTDAKMKAAAKKADRLRKAEKRAAVPGHKTREEYIANSDAELARQLGCSRKTIGRRKKVVHQPVKEAPEPLAKSRPWEAAGVSRTTWFRRQKIAREERARGTGTVPCPTSVRHIPSPTGKGDNHMADKDPVGQSQRPSRKPTRKDRKRPSVPVQILMLADQTGALSARLAEMSRPDPVLADRLRALTAATEPIRLLTERVRTLGRAATMLIERSRYA